MKFSIITPTYKRSILLMRTIKSVVDQKYTNWEMIIVNDSPEDTSYQQFISSAKDGRVRYYVNDKNRGVNYSRNFAMDNVSSDSDWIIFLDDDDYLSPEALEELKDLILSKQNIKWFVTNRAYADGRLITKFPKNDNFYSYIWDSLILKKCKGDVTHCINTKLIKNIRYSKHIKQAEEWLFYYQISLKEKMYYSSLNTTLTDGYDETHGLNFRKRSRSQEYDNLKSFVKEGCDLKILHHVTFIIYLLMRLIRLIAKTN